MNIEISPELTVILNKIAQKIHKPNSELVAEALRFYLEDLEDAEDAAVAYQEWQQEGCKTIPFDKVLKDLELN